MSRAVALATLLVLALGAQPASAKRILVNPGPGTPLQDAIDAADPGDTLKIQPGTYAEAITIDKPLRLMGRDAVIDAGCAVLTAVVVAADAVTLKSLEVRGGNFYTIDAASRDRLVVDRVAVFPTCVGVEYGINVFQGTNMRIRNNRVEDPVGYGDAGIYIGGTPPDADLRVERNVLIAPNDRGIIVEDSLDNPGKPVAVRVRRNEITGAGTGIFVFGSTGAEILNNIVTNGTAAGIEVTANSSDNLLRGNRLSGNVPDVLDAGTNNCWRSNHYTTGTVADCE
jgi:parallel beta-helix repeat protein